MEDGSTLTDRPGGVLVWQEGRWRCELHAHGGAWRLHLFRGEDCLATRAVKEGDRQDRAEMLRQCICMRDALPKPE